uniref:BZIP domain-containing protein n=1 Tax=Strongyloides papillosus TaxID=174720 RepID=A0A0N5C4V7_STREA
MLRRLFKRSSHKKTEDPNHQAFVAAYTAMKPQWLDKQRSCSHLSPEEQDQGIIELMEADGHRASLGASVRPPRQNGIPIGTYSTSFDDYVSRVDGISMDSIDMLQNTPLNNEHRHQYIDGLDENLRILVPQPDHDSTWHAFKQEYFKGFSRLHPRKNSTSSNRNHNRQRKKAKYNHKINNVEAELQRQSSLLSDITSKLSLFDVPKVALTVVTLFALLCSSSAWTCSEQPPFYPLIYRQFNYAFSSFSKVDISAMEEVCVVENFRPAYIVGDILIDSTRDPLWETSVKQFGMSNCGKYKVYQNMTDTELFLLNPDVYLMEDSDVEKLLTIYAYHYSFNASCSSASDSETQVPLGRLVPDSPVKPGKKRLRTDLMDGEDERTDMVNDAEYLKAQKEIDGLKATIDELRDQLDTMDKSNKQANDDSKQVKTDDFS